MLHIKNFKNIEHGLKLLKSKVIRTKQNRILNNRRYFKKPSVERREELLKAKYVQKNR